MINRDKLINQAIELTVRRLNRGEFTEEEKFKFLEGYVCHISNFVLNDFLLALFINLPGGQENYSEKLARYGHVWLSEKKREDGKRGLERMPFEIWFSPSKAAREGDTCYVQRHIGQGSFHDRRYSLIRGGSGTENSILRDTEKVMELIGLEKDSELLYNTPAVYTAASLL